MRPIPANRFGPVAVVGVIEADHLVFKPVRMRSDPRIPLQLRRVRIQIENVLRGDVAGNSAEFFYYTWAGGFDGNQPLGFWRLGDRRVFLLRWDSGILRTACDGADGCTWGIFSGAHPGYRSDPKQPVGYAIADILLTRREGRIRESRFAGAVEREAPAPFEYLIERLGRLATTERSSVKTSACRVLWTYTFDSSGTRRTAAVAWMRDAGCVCTPKPNSVWGVDCGPEDHINSDPPF